jgi:PAS domain S-box-containing protein
MPNQKTSDILSEMQNRVAELELRLKETEETLQAIRNGEVDAIIVSGENGEKVFSLVSSETPYRILIEKMDEGAVTVLSNGTVVYSNESFSRIISHPLENITGKVFSSFLPPDERERFAVLLSEGLTKPVKGDITVYASGRNLNLHLSLSPLSTEIEGDVCIIVSDVTEITTYQNYLKEMVEERTAELRIANTKLSGEIGKLRQAQTELKNSREKLNIALENGQIGTWEWDVKTNSVILDQRTEKMLGVQPGTFKGTLKSFQSLIHEEDLPHWSAAINEALTEGRPFETVFRTHPVRGETSFITSKALIVRNHEGTPLCMTGVCFDVTAMKKGAEQVLIRLNEDLLRSNTDLQQFAYVASHDLQEPLRMVSSFTQLIQQKYHDKLDRDGNEFIRYAVEGSKRMYELLNGLLAYSRLQTKAREFSDVDMDKVFEIVLDNLNLIIMESGATIKTGNLPVIFADENQMIQLLQNLIENGIKFRKGPPEINVSCKIEPPYYIFAVADNGIGIEPQYFDRIFRIFQRLHRIDEYGGTGIGLAICKRIVERHGGTIWVDSSAGKGSTFFFSIPVEPSFNHFV